MENMEVDQGPPRSLKIPSSSMSSTELKSSLNNSSSSVVKLNIGGYKYHTTKDTLCSGGSHFFEALLGGKFSVLKDEKGYIFIDRDGQYFAPILEYLRTGEFAVPSSMRMQSVMRELEFFGVSYSSHHGEEIALRFDGAYSQADNAQWFLFHSDHTGEIFNIQNQTHKRDNFQWFRKEGELSLTVKTTNESKRFMLIREKFPRFHKFDLALLRPYEGEVDISYQVPPLYIAATVTSIVFDPSHVYCETDNGSIMVADYIRVQDGALQKIVFQFQVLRERSTTVEVYPLDTHLLVFAEREKKEKEIALMTLRL